MNIFYRTAVAAALVATATAEEAHEHSINNFLEELNPALSVVIDANYYHEDSDDGLAETKEEMPGFGHGHGEEEHDHGQENGFNLREVEVYLSGTVDGYFTAEATLAFDEDDTEVETAVIETTDLPWGFTLKGGKFFSGFGIVNAQHPHQWQFSDQPLIYELTLGDHGLNEVGVQAVWQPETSYHLAVGAELLEGDNEKMFAYEGDEPLPSHDGPRLGVGWLKFGPDLGHDHTLRFGVFGGYGNHQEVHEEAPGEINYLDGYSSFAGADAIYRYNAHGELGQGDIMVQGEYFYRNKDLELEASDDPLAPLGEDLDANQDGYYLQALYGIFPRWRCGLRWDQVGMTNDEKEPGEDREDYGDSGGPQPWSTSAPHPTHLFVFRSTMANMKPKTATRTY